MAHGGTLGSPTHVLVLFEGTLPARQAALIEELRGERCNALSEVNTIRLRERSENTHVLRPLKLGEVLQKKDERILPHLGTRMSGDYEIERRCLYKNKRGIVQLSNTHVIWSPDSAEDGPELRIGITNITNFQVSKQASAKKAAIRLECKEYGTVMLNFQTNFTEREAVREVILKMMARGKQVLAKQNASGNGKSGPKAQPTPALSPQEREWRGKLMGKREVLRLRRRLVDTGAISDDTFWNGMKYRYKLNCELRANGKEVEGENPIEAKDLGVPANVFSVRKGIPVSVSDWGKIPTPAQQHVAILEHPSVARARKALVKQIGEESFWEMFRWSSMAQHKTLSRAETAQMAEADTLFAPYLAREREMEQQEREMRVKGLYKGLDLGHSDDHRSSHVLDGHTMAGEAMPAKRSRGPDTTALRLLKTVNRHASLIVEEGNVANWRDEANSARPLEDLEDQEEPEYAKFDMEAKRQVPASGKRRKVVMGSVVQAVWNDLENWEPDLSRFARPITGTGKELETIIKKMQV